MVALRDQIKLEWRAKSKGRSIHFQDLNHGQKRRACQLISGSPLRFSAVLGWKNTPDAAVFTERNQLYFYLTRDLIERVSWFCRDYRGQVREGDGKARITFSRRGSLSYDGFRSYRYRLREKETTSIHWPVIDIDAVDAADHSRLAALQIADCGTSAIAAAIEKDPYGNVEDAHLRQLSDNIYRRKGNYLSYGLKFLPTTGQANLNADQAGCFAPFE